MITTSSLARPLIALAAVLAATSVSAKEPVVVTGHQALPGHQAQVDFADLNLRRSKARQVLFRRAMDAAWAVCIAAEGRRGARLAYGDPSGNCPNSTYRAARPQIMAAIRRAQSGAPHPSTALIIAAPAPAR